jgi:hypothetical protein
MRALLLVCLAACTAPLVSTNRAHIDSYSRWVGHTHSVIYKKEGVTLGDETCGPQYMRAVSGVPQAEDLMRECARGTTGFELGVLGAVAFPLTGLAIDEWGPNSVGHTALVTGISLGVTSYLIGLASNLVAHSNLADAVTAYNQAVDTGVEQR